MMWYNSIMNPNRTSNPADTQCVSDGELRSMGLYTLVDRSDTLIRQSYLRLRLYKRSLIVASVGILVASLLTEDRNLMFVVGCLMVLGMALMALMIGIYNVEDTLRGKDLVKDSIPRVRTAHLSMLPEAPARAKLIRYGFSNIECLMPLFVPIQWASESGQAILAMTSNAVTNLDTIRPAIVSVNKHSVLVDIAKLKEQEQKDVDDE